MNRRVLPTIGISIGCCLAAAIIAIRASAGTPPPYAAKEKSAQVDRIVIQTDLWVLIPDAPFKSTFIIARHGSRYELKGMAYDGRAAHLYSGPVPPAAVDQLAEALQAPLQPSFTFASLGIHARTALESVKTSIRKDLQDPESTLSEKVLLNSIVDNPSQIEGAISRSSPITHTDDYGSLSVAMDWSDGRRIAAKAGAQHLYLLPWSIKGRGRTFDPAIAVAMLDLLPKQNEYRGRLEYDEEAEQSLMEMFNSGMSPQFSMLQAENASASTVGALRAAFDVQELGIFGSLRDRSFSKGAPRDLAATLKLLGTPKNLDMQFRIIIVHGKAVNLVSEMARAKALFKLVAGSPILAGEMAVNAGNRFTIRYWYGTSLHSDQLDMYGDEFDDFSRFMQKKIGIALTKQQLADAALVGEEGRPERDWVVLPDGRTVLWHELSTDPEDLSDRAESCAMNEDEIPIYNCVGRVFAADGKVIH